MRDAKSQPNPAAVAAERDRLHARHEDQMARIETQIAAAPCTPVRERPAHRLAARLHEQAAADHRRDAARHDLEAEVHDHGLV